MVQDSSASDHPNNTNHNNSNHNNPTPNNNTNPNDTTNDPVDISYYQTPKLALKNLRFIINLILGGVLGWVINFIVALVATLNTTRTSLWLSVKDFYSADEQLYVKMYALPIWVDFLVSGVLTGFLGGILGYFTIRYEVSRGKKRPIHPQYFQPFKIYSILGVNNMPYMLLRAAIYTCWGMLIAYPICLILFAVLCNANVFHTMLMPEDFTREECFLSRRAFCLIKGLFCIIVTTLIAPLIEMGELNKNSVSKNTLQRYMVKKAEEKKHQEDELHKKDKQEDFLPKNGSEKDDVEVELQQHQVEYHPDVTPEGQNGAGFV